jgi:hypothetical protein
MGANRLHLKLKSEGAIRVTVRCNSPSSRAFALIHKQSFEMLAAPDISLDLVPARNSKSPDHRDHSQFEMPVHEGQFLAKLTVFARLLLP